MKFNIVFSVGLALLLCLQNIEARQFDKCSLAQEMDRLGVSRDELPDWVCIGEHESSFNTEMINNYNTDNSKDWGIFQINDRYWCDPKDGRETSNGCNVDCSKVLIDDITSAVRCVQKIKDMQGFTAWVAWNTFCQGDKPGVSECF